MTKPEPWEIVQSLSLVHAYASYNSVKNKDFWACGAPYPPGGHRLGWEDVTCLRCLDAVIRKHGAQYARGQAIKRFNELQAKLKVST